MFVLTEKRYWQNKKGSVYVLCVAITIQGAIKWLDDRKDFNGQKEIDKPEYSRKQWSFTNNSASKFVDYDGAGVDYDIREFHVVDQNAN